MSNWYAKKAESLIREYEKDTESHSKAEEKFLCRRRSLQRIGGFYMQVNFAYKTETKTCYRFETGERPDMMTLYLKKKLVDDAGIDPTQGITVTIEQQKED